MAVGGPRSDQAARACRHRRAGGHHVVDEDEVRSRYRLRGAPAEGERAGHVAPPGLARPARLRGRGSRPHQPLVQHPHAALAAERVGEQRGLVVAAPEQAPAMQGDGDQPIRRRQHAARGRAHPPRQQRRHLGAVAAFEGDDQPPGGIVIAQRGAGADERRRVADAGAAHRVVAARQLEGRAAARAQRSGDEAQRRPAGRAQPAVTLYGGAAAQALGRHEEVDRRLGPAREAALQRPRSPGRRILVRDGHRRPFKRRRAMGSNPRGRAAWGRIGRRDARRRAAIPAGSAEPRDG